MAKKGKTEADIESELPEKDKDKERVIEEKKEKEEVIEDDEEYFEENINASNIRFPFYRRSAPSIRIQPVSVPLEIDLADVSITPKKEEDNSDLYKATGSDKNYSLSQKYELPGAGSYSESTPRQISGPSQSFSPSITPTTQSFNTPNPFRPTDGSATGYPGQDSGERKYDSGLERQSQETEKRRRDM